MSNLRETDPASHWEYDTSKILPLIEELGEGEYSRGPFGGCVVLSQVSDSPTAWIVETKGFWLPFLSATIYERSLGLCGRKGELVAGNERTAVADELTKYLQECYRGYEVSST